MKKTVFLVFANLLLISGMVTLFVDPNVLAQGYGTISGMVYDINNRPISNVTVYLTNDMITTIEEANAAGLAAVGPYVPVTPTEDELMVARRQPPEEVPVVVIPPTPREAHYVMKAVPVGTYTVNARALREDGKVASGRVQYVEVWSGENTYADIVLDIARPDKIRVSVSPTRLSSWQEKAGVKPDEAVVTAILLDFYGQPVGANYMVTFSVSAGTVQSEPALTDVMGRCSVTYVADTTIAGEILLTATYVDPETLRVISDDTTIKLLPSGASIRERHLGSIKGKVVDIDNKPISGAKIRLDGIATATDEEGMFEIHGVVPGDYILTVTAEDKEIKRIVTVIEDECAYVTIIVPIKLQTYAHKVIVNLPVRREIYLERGNVIEIKAHAFDGSSLTVDIFNSIGKCVYSKTSESGTISILYHAQSSGPYILEFRSPEGERSLEIEYTITLHRGQRVEDILIE